MSDHHDRRNRADSDGSPRKIFIGGLSYSTDDDTLRKYFSDFGQVDDAVVMKDPSTRRSRGFGFITFRELLSVEGTMAKEHIIDSRKVEVKRAVPKNDATLPTGPSAPSSVKSAGAPISAAKSPKISNPKSISASDIKSTSDSSTTLIKGTVTSKISGSNVSSSNNSSNTNSTGQGSASNSASASASTIVKPLSNSSTGSDLPDERRKVGSTTTTTSSTNNSTTSASTGASTSSSMGSTTSTISAASVVSKPKPSDSSSKISSHNSSASAGGNIKTSSTLSSIDESPRFSADEYSAKKLFVGGLHYDTRDADFKSYFEKYGRVQFAEVMLNRETHKSRGFGFIVFEKEESVDNVCDQKEHVIHGKVVEVKRAIPRFKIGTGDHAEENTTTTSSSSAATTTSTTKPSSVSSVSNATGSTRTVKASSSDDAASPVSTASHPGPTLAAVVSGAAKATPPTSYAAALLQGHSESVSNENNNGNTPPATNSSAPLSASATTASTSTSNVNTNQSGSSSTSFASSVGSSNSATVSSPPSQNSSSISNSSGSIPSVSNVKNSPSSALSNADSEIAQDNDFGRGSRAHSEPIMRFMKLDGLDMEGSNESTSVDNFSLNDFSHLSMDFGVGSNNNTRPLSLSFDQLNSQSNSSSSLFSESSSLWGDSNLLGSPSKIMSVIGRANDSREENIPGRSRTASGSILGVSWLSGNDNDVLGDISFALHSNEGSSQFSSQHSNQNQFLGSNLGSDLDYDPVRSNDLSDSSKYRLNSPYRSFGDYRSNWGQGNNNNIHQMQNQSQMSSMAAPGQQFNVGGFGYSEGNLFMNMSQPPQTSNQHHHHQSQQGQQQQQQQQQQPQQHMQQPQFSGHGMMGYDMNSQQSSGYYNNTGFPMHFSDISNGMSYNNDPRMNNFSRMYPNSPPPPPHHKSISSPSTQHQSMNYQGQSNQNVGSPMKMGNVNYSSSLNGRSDEMDMNQLGYRELRLESPEFQPGGWQNPGGPPFHMR